MRRRSEFARDVAAGLASRPRQLAPKYFYDALGGALFDAICELPWYRITRAERALLSEKEREVARCFPRLFEIVELGPGDGSKLALLLRSFSGRRRKPYVTLVDISGEALRRASARLADWRVRTVRAGYRGGVDRALGKHRRGACLVLFLGSNIGNYAPEDARDFLRRLARRLAPGDGVLLGTDLVKPRRELELAYDDPLGVTAAFNRNILTRINRELGGDFDPEAFSHRARWNAANSRIEMHLVSRRRQRVRVRDAGLLFWLARGETIWTESSYKFTPAGVSRLLADAGLTTTRQWVAAEAGFALTLARAEGSRSGTHTSI